MRQNPARRRPGVPRPWWRTLLVGATVLPGALAAQARPAPTSTERLNLGFESRSTVAPRTPAGWYVGGQGYEVVLDSAAPYAGTHALRSRAVGAPAQGAFGVAGNSMPAEGAVGRTIRLRGYIRTEGVTTGRAGLWVRTDSANGRPFAIDNMAGRSPSGTTAWAPYEVSLPVDSATRRIAFGVLHPGDGTAWFDSLSLSVDGRPWVELGPAPWSPTAAEAAWLRRAVLPLAGVDADAPTRDLAPIGALLGDARIVALGEGTHGTSEFFRMKHRLTRFLATEHGFTVFAIEASMPEARRLNEYVLTGRGDPAALLAGMYFWTWNTREVLDLIEWMRAYNASGRGRMEFWGFDLQTPDVAMDSVRAFVARVDPGFAPMVDSAYARVREASAGSRQAGRPAPATVRRWAEAARAVRAYLEANRSRHAAATADTMEIAWAAQYARIVEQGAASAGMSAVDVSARDSSMADNVRWMLAHLPAGTKAVLWAHNGHVQREAGRMGRFLDATYGAQARVVGFALGDGEYTAFGPRGLAGYRAEPPPAGSVEAALRATGVPRLALDLRAASRQLDGAWLATPHDFRRIGAMALDRAFFPTPVAEYFDLLVYLDHTTPTALIRPAGAR